MTTETGTFTEFLTARLDEDETVARAANTIAARTPWGDESIPPVPEAEWGALVDGYLGGPIGVHCARHDPARVLAEVAAKRRMVEAADGRSFHGRRTPDDAEAQRLLHPALRALASVYADHPDYRQEWA